MTKGKRDCSCECTLCRVVEKSDDILEDQVVILTDWHKKIVCSNSFTLTIFNQSARLVSLRDLNIFRNATKYLIGLSVIETDQNEPGCSANICPVNIAL